MTNDVLMIDYWGVLHGVIDTVTNAVFIVIDYWGVVQGVTDMTNAVLIMIDYCGVVQGDWHTILIGIDYWGC